MINAGIFPDDILVVDRSFKGVAFLHASSIYSVFSGRDSKKEVCQKRRGVKKGSLIGQKPKARETVRSLGLKKINSFTEREINPMIQGMLDKIEHLVEIEEIK